MTPLSLAARVEALSGADREVDVAVFRAIGAPVPFQFASAIVALTYDEAERCYFAPVGDMRVRYEPPAYTASIDAAMSLAPDGWACSMFKYARPKNPARTWHVRFEDVPIAPFKPTDFQSASAEGPTLALAITAAALKALAHIPKDASHD